MSISKREKRAKKALLQKLVSGTNMYENVWCQSQRLNCQSSFKMFMASILKKMSCFDQKYVNGIKKKKSLNQL